MKIPSFKPKGSEGFSAPERQSMGILDDYAVRKNVATRELTVNKMNADSISAANIVASSLSSAMIYTPFLRMGKATMQYNQSDQNIYWANPYNIDINSAAELHFSTIYSADGYVSIMPNDRQLWNGNAEESLDWYTDFIIYKDIYTAGDYYIGTPDAVFGRRTKVEIELADGSDTDIITLDIAAGESKGGTIEYLIKATDGSDTQTHTGSCYFAVAFSADGLSMAVDIDEAYVAAQRCYAATAGTLTDTFSIVADVNNAQYTIKCNANSSMTDPIIQIKCTFLIL